MSAEDKIESVRQRWDDFSERFTATANKRVTIQCARELHAHMQLGSALNVLEVAAGAGLGSLDIIARMTSGSRSDSEQKEQTSTQRQLTVTDLAPRMVELAKVTLQHATTEHVAVRVMEANGQDLTDVATGSMDRFIANMCLQLTPDADAMLRETKRVLTPDGIAGFTIWGRPEHSGIFTIDTAAAKELGLGDGAQHSNFALGRDLAALRQRFAAAGFSHVRIWPFLCVLALWSGDEYATFQHEMSPLAERERLYDVWKRMGDEWLATTGLPIGLEAYIVIARA